MSFSLPSNHNSYTHNIRPIYDNLTDKMCFYFKLISFKENRDVNWNNVTLLGVSTSTLALYIDCNRKEKKKVRKLIPRTYFDDYITIHNTIHIGKTFSLCGLFHLSLMPFLTHISNDYRWKILLLLYISWTITFCNVFAVRWTTICIYKERYKAWH